MSTIPDMNTNGVMTSSMWQYFHCSSMEINVKFMFLNVPYVIRQYCTYYNYNSVENV